ncbi:MAG: ParB/RepB/Spo0J family partition protein [Akkermansia sp.]|nr:ParB/RepB/Spo0J family partition protein [Akkermansia sp.]
MARQALGKGLGALLSKKQSSLTTSADTVAEGEQVILAPISEIVASPFQPRRHFDEEQIEELAASIRESGLIQPLVVRRVDGKFELIAGERRLRAVTRLGQTEVRVVVHEATDQEVAELTLIENLQRADLTPMEEAEQYHLLQTRFGMKQELIAQHVGKSRVVVANMVRLLDLTPTARELLNSKKISVGHAKVLLQLKDAEQQTAAAEKVAAKGLTVRQTEQLVRALLTPAPETSAPAPAKKHELPEAYERVCRQLSGDFGTEVTISLKGKNNGTIEISYAGREELVRILQIFGINARF